jgi:hypothetical protein
MMSEQAYAYLSGPVRPSWEALVAWREGHPIAERQVRDLRGLRPQLVQLAPYRREVEAVDAWLREFEAELAPLYDRAEQLRKTLLLHLALWLVLLLAPLMAWLLGAKVLLVGLLFLPVLGWTYLGLWAFSKKAGMR